MVGGLPQEQCWKSPLLPFCPRQVTQVLAYFYRNGRLDVDNPVEQDVSLASRMNNQTHPLKAEQVHWRGQS